MDIVCARKDYSHTTLAQSVARNIVAIKLGHITVENVKPSLERKYTLYSVQALVIAVQ